ncbi:MAG: flagellin [Sulfuritalea sp.]|nr:flagellin [Sulfuritalea sp.]
MAQVINTNVASLFGQQALNKSASGLQTAMQRLSSGLRINNAKDDATGMANAAVFESQMRGANQALRNANDGIAKAQINDGYHAQVLENLQRQREIAVQQGGTATSTEATALVTENTRLLGLAVATGSVVVESDGGTVTGLATAAASITAGLTIASIDAAITAVTTARAKYGADMATFSSAAASLGTEAVNAAAQYSRVMDTDYAVETTNMIRNQILQQAGTAMLAQANQVPNSVLSLLR